MFEEVVLTEDVGRRFDLEVLLWRLGELVLLVV